MFTTHRLLGSSLLVLCVFSMAFALRCLPVDRTNGSRIAESVSSEDSADVARLLRIRKQTEKLAQIGI